MIRFFARLRFRDPRYWWAVFRCNECGWSSPIPARPAVQFHVPRRDTPRVD